MKESFLALKEFLPRERGTNKTQGRKIEKRQEEVEVQAPNKLFPIGTSAAFPFYLKRPASDSTFSCVHARIGLFQSQPSPPSSVRCVSKMHQHTTRAPSVQRLRQALTNGDTSHLARQHAARWCILFQWPQQQQRKRERVIGDRCCRDNRERTLIINCCLEIAP